MSKRLTALGILAGMAAAAETADRLDRIASRHDRVVYVPTSTSSQPYPQYHQGGRPTQRGYYSAPVRQQALRETAICLSDIIEACDGKLRSVGRELAYQIHRAEKSGWHSDYYMSCDVRRDIRRIAEYEGVSHIRPHDSDYQYERLAEAIIGYVRHSDLV